ncbi:MAG TPA: hypothetical protein VGX70_11140 [Gemmataceae bacterium]|nr:hypothetical protein [Gemmataceae bacterium]
MANTSPARLAGPGGGAMVALSWLLAEETSEPRIRLILAAFAIVIIILVGAGIIEVVKRWRKRPYQSKISASEQLAQFRESFEKGQISQEEFERIRALLNERIRQEMEVPAAASATPQDEKPPPSDTPER